MDVRGTELRDVRRAGRSTAAGWPARSAGSAWRSSAPPTRARPTALADDLGVAMQLTNILRDVREDLEQRARLPAGRGPRRFGCEDLARRRPTGVARPDRASRPSARASGSTAASELLPLLDAPQRLVRAGDDRHLPAHARADRRRRPSWSLASGCRCRRWEKAWVAARSLAGARHDDEPPRARDRGRRRPGRDHRRARLRRGRRGGHAASRSARGSAAPPTPSSATGSWLDNGQHVFLRCCTAYRALLRPARRRPTDRSCRSGWRSRCWRPAGPMRLAAPQRRCRRRCTSSGSLLRYRHLSPPQRLSAARAALALARPRPRRPRTTTA